MDVVDITRSPSGAESPGLLPISRLIRDITGSRREAGRPLAAGAGV